MKKITIPNSKLEEGFQLCKAQSKMLLDSSEILSKKRKYVISIGLSILAKEELTKMRIFYRFLIRGLAIEQDMWKVLTDHNVKLGLPFFLVSHSLRKKSPLEIVQVKNFANKMGIKTNLSVLDTLKEPNEKYIQFVESLDIVKQDCHFVNWINNDWFSLLNNYDENTQKSIAKTLHAEALLDYYTILINFKRKKSDPVVIPKTITGNKYRKIIQYTDSREFKKISALTYKTISRDYKKRYLEKLEKRMKQKRHQVKIPM